MKLARTLALCLVAAACASAQVEPEAPAPLDPVGLYDFTTAIEGDAVSGTITITRTSQGYGGTITTNISDPIPVRSVVVDDRRITVTGDTPDGPVTLTMNVDGDDFAGTWSFGGMSGTHSGKRRR